MLLTFISLACGGFLFLIITLMFGGDHEIEVDHDFDVGHEFDPEHDVGGSHHWFSLKVIAAFITAFGAGGAIARAYGIENAAASIGIALASGIVIAIAADFIIVAMYKQQASSSFSIEEITGKIGMLSLAIQKEGIGEVQVRHKGSIISKPARSEDGKPIKQGERVKILSADDPLIVQKV